jgi:hypothetical protein
MCSTTAELSKIRGDAEKVKKHFDEVTVLLRTSDSEDV